MNPCTVDGMQLGIVAFSITLVVIGCLVAYGIRAEDKSNRKRLRSWSLRYR